MKLRNSIGFAVHVALVSGVVSGSITPEVVVAQDHVEEPIRTTVCELLKDPKKFDGKMVQLRATVLTGFELSALKDDACSEKRIWLELGGTESFAGEDDLEYAWIDPPSAWIDAPNTQNPSELPWLRFRQRFAFNKDDSALTLFRYLGEKYDHENGQPSRTMNKYSVSALFVGRFDHSAALFRAVRTASRGIAIWPGGFGHLRMEKSQLATVSVSDVVATPIDRSVYGKSN